MDWLWLQKRVLDPEDAVRLRNVTAEYLALDIVGPLAESLLRAVSDIPSDQKDAMKYEYIHIHIHLRASNFSCLVHSCSSLCVACTHLMRTLILSLAQTDDVPLDRCGQSARSARHASHSHRYSPLLQLRVAAATGREHCKCTVLSAPELRSLSFENATSAAHERRTWR